MTTTDKKYYEWLSLLLATITGMGFALWGYYQIINLPSLTSLEINKLPKIVFIFSPENNSIIKNPTEISGKIIAPEKTFKIRIKDKNNNVLKEEYLNLGAAKSNFFKISADYQQPTARLGLIQIFEYSAEDDFEINHRSIPVQFSEFK